MGEIFQAKEFLKEDLRQQLEILLELRDSSVHQAGQASVENKNGKALQAIKLANYMVFGAAGWAFNHVAGYALDPEADEDQHQHEIRGIMITDSDFVMRGETYRPALAALLRSLDGVLPRLTAHMLANALVALNVREVHPILRPIKGRHRKKSNSKMESTTGGGLLVASVTSSGHRFEDRAGNGPQRLRVSTLHSDHTEMARAAARKTRPKNGESGD